MVKDHIQNLRELHEAQFARAGYFVHELTSEVNTRMRCMAKVMAMPRKRTAVTDLCMFGLAACYEGGPGCQRKRADDHQCETSWVCGCRENAGA